MTPYIIDTGSDEGAWADALRFATFPVQEYRPRSFLTADDASGCEGHPADPVTSGRGNPVRAFRLQMGGNGGLSHKEGSTDGPRYRPAGKRPVHSSPS